MTLAELIIDFKNMVGPAGRGSEVSNSGIAVWLQEAHDDVVDEIIRVNPSYFNKTTLISLVAGQTEYALPTDFVGVISVEIAYEVGSFVRAEKLQNYRDLDATFSTANPKYLIMGDNIIITPAPELSGDSNLRIVYSFLQAEMQDTVEIDLPRPLQRKLKYLAYANYLDQNDEHVAAERMRVRFEKDVNKFLDNIVVRNSDSTPSVVISNGGDLFVDEFYE